MYKNAPTFTVKHGRSLFPPNLRFCFSNYLPINVWMCGSQQTVENFQRDGNTRPPDFPAARETCSAGQEATVRAGHGTTDWFKTGKELYCHPAYLTYCRVNHVKCWAG